MRLERNGEFGWADGVMSESLGDKIGGGDKKSGGTGLLHDECFALITNISTDCFPGDNLALHGHVFHLLHAAGSRRC